MRRGPYTGDWDPLSLLKECWVNGMSITSEVPRVDATVSGEVLFADLDRNDLLRLLWGFAWRGVCFTLITAALGFVLGAVLGFVGTIAARIAGLTRDTYGMPLQIVCSFTGFALGLWALRYYLGWILRARFGTLRFALIRS